MKNVLSNISSWLIKVLSSYQFNRLKPFTYLQLFRIFYKRLNFDSLLTHSRSIAFSLTLSLFPALIFIFSIIPFVGSMIKVKDLEEQIIIYLSEVMPTNIFEISSPTIIDIITNRNVGLLSFGFLFAIYFSSNGIMNLISTFDMIYKTKNSRNYFNNIVVSLLITGILVMTFLTSIFFMGISQFFFTEAIKFIDIVEELVFFHSISGLITTYFTTYIIFLISISSMYYMAPSVKVRWAFFSTGSIVASILCLLITIFFTLYINYFGGYNKIYGSIGTMIAIMVWIWWISLSLLFGFQINAAIQLSQRSYEKKIIKKIKNLAK